MSEGTEPTPTSHQPAERQGEKHPTPEDFIVKWPLYTPFKWDEFSPPNRISFHCGSKCAKETTWHRQDCESYYSQTGGVSFTSVYYMCSLCEEQYLLVLYRELEHRTKLIQGNRGPFGVRVATKVQKIGQHPALSISISQPLEKNLGAGSASLYKKALINRNEGNGLAAITYLRRVVEDKTDELIGVVAELGEAHNVGTEVVEQIKAAITERTTYDRKLKIAATVLPASLTPDGINPLGTLYDLVSVGVHDLDEEECIKVADETRDVLEFTFSRLRAEAKERQAFVAKIKRLTTFKKSGSEAKSLSDDREK